MPSLSLQIFVVPVEMSFDDLNILQGTSIEIWESQTSTYLYQELRNKYADEFQPDTLRVTCKLTKQSFVSNTIDNDENDKNVTNTNLTETENDSADSDNPPSLLLRRRRYLQTDRTPSFIVFLVDVQFRSILTFEKNNITNDIGSSFNTENKRFNYILQLQNTNDRSFATINQITVKVDGVEVPIITPVGKNPPEENNPSGSSSFPIFVPILATVATVIVVGGLAAYYFVYKRNDSNSNASGDHLMQQEDDYFNASGSNPDMDQRVSTFVKVEPQQMEDVSTLGDPVMGMILGAVTSKKSLGETTRSSVTNEFDYAAAYGVGQSRTTLSSSVSSSTSSRRQQQLKQQKSGEEKTIVIHAPPGRLGIVIDTPDGQPALIHAIKDTSILKQDVRVGDRLLSVDGDDTTKMSSIQISRIISQRSQNPIRTLIFSRTSTNSIIHHENH